ncbi:hypothetical protein DFR52_102155 [Hoeflea marina]|uniref:Uncharacterized protein n=1 Tax=Hoeflea marina TaxID=274592 RepID=A0A317PLV5_9HYPH|nr:hypothetical protein DFR52_102155 [Hoeflea marina]
MTRPPERLRQQGAGIRSPGNRVLGLLPESEPIDSIFGIHYQKTHVWVQATRIRPWIRRV